MAKEKLPTAVDLDAKAIAAELELDTTQYLTIKEERAIAAYNRKKMHAHEKEARRSDIPESEYISQMQDDNNVVEFDGLRTHFFTDVGTVEAVNGVTFSVPRGKTVGIVGESGCGKSVTSLSLMRLVQEPQGQIVGGKIRYKDSNGKCYDVAKMPRSEMLKVRGQEISMIFQEPMTSLNPVFTIGEQMDEVTLLHDKDATPEIAKERSLEMLKLVGIPNRENIYRSYPHELSGGMRQRVMIGMALACKPSLLIADEPTTALDVTIQAQILDLLRGLKETSQASIMLITHDLGVIAEMADFVVVMYAGKIIERGTVREIFNDPRHPYTIGLMRSKPTVDKVVEKLYSIPGQVPNPINMPNHCYFKNRCESCVDACEGEYPPLVQISETHFAACHRNV